MSCREAVYYCREQEFIRRLWSPSPLDVWAASAPTTRPMEVAVQQRRGVAAKENIVGARIMFFGTGCYVPCYVLVRAKVIKLPGYRSYRSIILIERWHDPSTQSGLKFSGLRQFENNFVQSGLRQEQYQ